MKCGVAIYTDGGCEPNPGCGGWACVIIHPGTDIVQLSGNMKETTNNIMELTAPIKALEYVKSNYPRNIQIVLHSDSQYLINGITSWIKGWKKNGWIRGKNEPVKNAELWQKLDELNQDMNIDWVWVKGHSGDTYNEMCDKLCEKEIQSLRGDRYVGGAFWESKEFWDEYNRNKKRAS